MKKRKLTELIIALFAAIAWLLFEAGGRYLGWQTAPVGSFQKVAFGVLGMSIISGIAWIWLSATQPYLKKLIDPDTIQPEYLSKWQQLKISLFFYGLYVFGTVVLASLY